MQFAKLRLSGFKSFVDSTDLLIAPGVTGIVGPNGCGKSNLVEALRWVMGEASAKRMRGAEMDDVIFGGTADRPARNLAEVALHLDNTARTAPAMFNDHDALEVSRRIERGSGSDYRVNGRSVRARDLQLLFQDNSTGANSPALVSQGRVGALIGAKPAERRTLLEEAAGITGLHSRRHEAELRLRAADGNMVRLEDVIAAMEAQLAGLKKQARQAARYRNMSARIRKAEAALLHLRWLAAQDRLSAARSVFDASEGAVREQTVAVARATTDQTDAAAATPPLRQAEAEAAAALQRLHVAREGFEAEERRVEEARADAKRRLEQIADDIDRERALAADAGEALARLDGERLELTAAREGEADARDAAGAALAETTQAVGRLDLELARLTERIAESEAQRRSLAERTGSLEGRDATLGRRLDEAARQKAVLQAEIADSPEIAAADSALAEAQGAFDRCAAAAGDAEAARQAAEAGSAEARATLQPAEAALAKLTAEADALAAILDTGDSDLFPPLIDAVTVDSGYEMALGAALGEDLTAPLDEAAAVHWRALPELQQTAPFPAGVDCLSDRVSAPAALARRLSHIGVVADEAAGRRLAAALAPGQQLVTRDGGHWRWDGYCAAEGAPTAAAARLSQRNRLAELDGEIAAARTAAAVARTAFETTERSAAEVTAHERAARKAVDAAFADVNRARDRQAGLARDAAARESRLAAVVETLDGLANDRDHAVTDLDAARSAMAALSDTTALRDEAAVRRQALAERRSEQAARQTALETLLREAAGRTERLSAIAAEERSWQTRSTGTEERLSELEVRAGEARDAAARLADRPAEIAAQRDALLSRIGGAEAARRAAADALAVGEQRLTLADRSLKAEEAALAGAREERVRAEAAVTAAVTAADSVRDRIAERLQCGPDGALAIAELKPDAAPSDPSAVEALLERLCRERDAMGPVNLRAETEAAELDEQIAGMLSERDDLVAAIGRLRQGIASLNREARERLLASFDTVNGHFQSLFVRLYGGGRAYLQLTEADDPLDAGLEIFASPPGKRLQHLSLLSGGEQALTALALLFAVFLTNPAPICVLDEVDAPLDDANVDRFCSLLEDLARDEICRFLVITHHRMTMARVDRLYGVTMPERGVSQLVSVDLQRAEALRRTA
ncbi:MAG: chromosome segregation protein SMC [Alphaproteobacteria bacterium]